ncbi:MAG: hypothetical protein MR332_09275 [Fusicatenibacter sp.]|nr:hypothetical protein [Fusicatenibacter sp.]
MTLTQNNKSDSAIHVWMTSESHPGSMEWYQKSFPIQRKLQNSTIPSASPVSERCDLPTVSLDPDTVDQEILGFGTSLEESTIYNLSKMSPQKREEILKKLIDPMDGAGMTLFRLTIGTADFTAQKFYTYYDTPPKGQPDWDNQTGSGFSIQKDHEYHIIDTILQLLRIAKELGVDQEIRFFSSPWSPPGWMKLPTPESESYPDNELLLKGGAMNNDYLEDLAIYYVRYLEEYTLLGIPIFAMTLQNEPYLEIDYPSCLMTPTQQAALARLLKQKIKESTILQNFHVNPLLWGFDHNFYDGWNYVNEISHTPNWNFLDGIAFHPYGGDASDMGKIADTFPDKNVYLTERAVWGAEGASEMITWLRNQSCSYNSWVTMLDSSTGTHQWVGTPGPTMMIQDADHPDEYRILPEFYLLGQFARFVRPGYRRISSDEGPSRLPNAAFLSPDAKTIVLIAVNAENMECSLRFICENMEFITQIPANTVATYQWNRVSC